MPDEVAVPEERQYLNLEIGPELKYDSNLATVEEIVFWLEAFKDRILDKLFDSAPDLPADPDIQPV